MTRSADKCGTIRDGEGSTVKNHATRLTAAREVQ
ncbi:hypothetical protein KPSA3_00851 [Pseudomonas syringae pv. actinidiae]|uniref:Uncharacterized protein n=1 Tax=Pseudomonas syringae pv. actinidiae TaxID=103796 RepID=A0AAN4Q074_PSESF|nr:hypothetical protein KPSA3_00851 [Pseudomonas syringae pv. actinidiae]